MSPDRRIGRMVSRAAVVVTALAFALPPALYFSLSYQHLAGSLESVAELNAIGIGRIIGTNPDLWEYEQVRLKEFLARRPRGGDLERRRVLDLAGAIVAEVSDPLPRPWVTEAFPLMDAGVRVGTIEVSRSLRPVILRSALLALALLPLCLVAFRVLRTAPLRAVRRSEEALRRQRDTAQLYLDVAGVAFVILDRLGRVLLLNRKGAEILGRGEGEVVGQEWLAGFVDLGDRARVSAGLASAARPGHVVELEYAVVRPSGERRTISWYVTPLVDGGEVTGLLASGIDITAQRQLEAHLGHARKLEALGELASGVAHDFNNIVCVIRGYASMLRRALPIEGALHEHALEIAAAADRAAALTDSLLTFSRRQEMRREPLDLVAVVRGLQRFLRHLAPPSVELVVELPGGPLPVTGDRGQLEQVLMNLVTNARDAMPRGGRITVTLSSVQVDAERARRAGLEGPGRHAELRVSDTGVGMDGETRARLFEPFFTTKEPGMGTGLGLSIVYGIVKKHHGSIDVASEPGRGATFTFLLPLRADLALVPPPPELAMSG